MKKYLFSFFAIVFAVAAVAFTTVDRTPTSDVYFQYDLNDFSDPDLIENPENWTEVTDEFGSCNNEPEKACRIKVDHTNTTGSSPTRELASGTAITASLYAPNSTYFVSGGADVLAFVNKD